MVHARSYIPATIGLALKKKFGLKLIFDVRGLMAEEYVDAKHWRQGDLRYRLTKSVERRLFAAADGVVTLTNKIWPIINKWDGLAGREVVHEVIPCCVDLELFKFKAEDRLRRRTELGLADRFVVVYSGSIDGWYLTEEMADFFSGLVRDRPAAHCVWLTPGKHDRIRALMTERGIAPDRYTVLAAASKDVPSYLSASALNHPHIAAIYGFEQSTVSSALVLELIDGPTLADVIAGRSVSGGAHGIPIDEALPIARQIP